MAAQPRDGGFTYLGVLFLVFLMGAGLALAGQVWHTAHQREKERELLWIGDQFRRAIGQYYDGSPGGAKRFPAKLENLLADDRFPTMRRHLRKVYVDPMTGKAEWGVIKAPDDGIMGVHSLGKDVPIKEANFPSGDAGFEVAATVADWKFLYRAPDRPGGAASPGMEPDPSQSPAGLLNPMLPGTGSNPLSAGGTKSAAPDVSKCEQQRVADVRSCTGASQEQPPRPSLQCAASIVARYSACGQGAAPPPLNLSSGSR
jgi:hypothetical protein